MALGLLPRVPPCLMVMRSGLSTGNPFPSICGTPSPRKFAIPRTSRTRRPAVWKREAFSGAASARRRRELLHRLDRISRAFRCEHERGKAGSLSDSDRRGSPEASEAEGTAICNGSGIGARIGGPGLYLDNRDLDLMAAFFAQPWCVALMRPSARQRQDSFYGKKGTSTGPAATGSSNFPMQSSLEVPAPPAMAPWRNGRPPARLRPH